MYTQNELLYPHYVTAQLGDTRGEMWQALIEEIKDLPESHEKVLAFSLMMIRLNGCLACETDSYRAMRGCESCAIQTLRRYKGPDDELLRIFVQALDDIRRQSNDSQQVSGNCTP